MSKIQQTIEKQKLLQLQLLDELEEFVEDEIDDLYSSDNIENICSKLRQSIYQS